MTSGGMGSGHEPVFASTPMLVGSGHAPRQVAMGNGGMFGSGHAPRITALAGTGFLGGGSR